MLLLVVAAFEFLLQAVCPYPHLLAAVAASSQFCLNEPFLQSLLVLLLCDELRQLNPSQRRDEFHTTEGR